MSKLSKKQEELKAKHGTPDDFIIACMDTLGEVSAREILDAIDKYRKEWAEAADPKTCREIKADWHAAMDEASAVYDAAILRARAIEFPVGTKVKFQHGMKWIRGVVHKLGEWDFNRDAAVVRNTKTGSDWEKKVWELERDDEAAEV